MGRQINAQHQRDSPYVKAVYRYGISVFALTPMSKFGPEHDVYLWHFPPAEFASCWSTVHFGPGSMPNCCGS